MDRSRKEDSGGSACEPDLMEEVELSSLLDLQDQREASESKQSSRVILKVCACLLALFAVWYAVSPTNRRKMDGLIQNLKESRNPSGAGAGSGGIAASYDEILQKLGTRSEEIDDASRTLGVDPSTVEEDGMDPEMKAMMGGKGRTPGERERIVGGLAHAAGVELPTHGKRMGDAAEVSAKPPTPVVAEPTK